MEGDPQSVGPQAVHRDQGAHGHDGQADQAHNAAAVGLMALQGGVVQEEGDHDLGEGDGGGDGRQRDQQIEQHPEQGTGSAHGVEHVLKGDEQQLGSGQLRPGTAQSEGGGQHRHTGQNGHQGVRDDNEGGVFHQVLLLAEIGAIGDGDAHGQGQREEHLPARSGEHPEKILLEHREVGGKHKFQSVDCPGQGQRPDDDDDQHNKQGGHTHFIEALDAVFDAAADDQKADGDEQEREQQSHGLVGEHVVKGLRTGQVGQLGQPQQLP